MEEQVEIQKVEMQQISYTVTEGDDQTIEAEVDKRMMMMMIAFWYVIH